MTAFERIRNSKDRAINRLADLTAEGRLPTRKNEDYRYTSLRSIRLDRKPQSVSKKDEIKDILSLSDELCIVLNRSGFLEGEKPRVQVISSEESPIFVGDLAEGLQSDSRLDRYSLEIPSELDDDIFANLSLQGALATTLVFVPKDVKLPGPIRIVNYMDSQSVASYFRTILLFEDHVCATVVEEFLGDGLELVNGTSEKPLSSGLTQLSIGQNSRVNYVQVQGMGSSVNCFLRNSSKVGAGSELDVLLAHSGGRGTQNRMELECVGQEAQIILHGAARGEGEQKFDFWVNARHSAPHTKSELNYWTVMADRAQAVFNGNLIIPQEAVHTDAFQKNRNLLLSDRAVIASNPKLEIAVDEVKCAHGASVSTVDEDQLYYLRSRGVSKQEATRLIVDGFTDPVLERIPVSATRERMKSRFSEKSLGEFSGGENG